MIEAGEPDLTSWKHAYEAAAADYTALFNRFKKLMEVVNRAGALASQKAPHEMIIDALKQAAEV